MENATFSQILARYAVVGLFGARAFRPTSRSGTVHLAEILMHNASSWGNWAVTFDLPSWFCPFTPLLDESKADKNETILGWRHGLGDNIHLRQF